jgi:hypothetical protein
MLLSIYLGVRLILSGPFRDSVLARLTFIRERDEREALLTGRATKTTLMTSLAILIFLFCLSCFQVSFFKLPPEKALDGKTRGFSLGSSSPSSRISRLTGATLPSEGTMCSPTTDCPSPVPRSYCFSLSGRSFHTTARCGA